jgi:predicted nucleic acid-binding Zn ribbon protein
MEAVGGVLARVIQQLGLETGLKGWKAAEDWPRIVGGRIARHTRCVGFSDGTLRVEVESSSWMHELGYLERDLVRKVNRHLGAELVREVKFVVPRGGILR